MTSSATPWNRCCWARSIEIEFPPREGVDLEARTASCRIEGLLESSAESIKSPVDGSPHRVKIQIPHGIEFETAEIVDARTRSTGDIELELDGTYGQICLIQHTHEGPAHNLRSA